MVQARGPAGARRIAVGRHGVIGANEARRRAALIVARIRAGEDPVPEAEKTESITVAALAERYLREHVAVRCKPTTAAQYRLAIERYIVPALGGLPVSALGRAQVADLQHALADRPAMANLAVATLSRMIERGIAWGVAGETTNPCRSAPKYRTRRRERFLTDAEFRRLGSTLDELEATGRLSAPRGGGAAAAHAHRLPAQRDPHPALGGRAAGGAGASPCRQQDRPAHGLALARGRSGAGPTAAPSRQPLGDPRREARRPALQPVRALAQGARPRGPGRRAPARPAPLLCSIFP